MGPIRPKLFKEAKTCTPGAKIMSDMDDSTGEVPGMGYGAIVLPGIAEGTRLVPDMGYSASVVSDMGSSQCQTLGMVPE